MKRLQLSAAVIGAGLAGTEAALVLAGKGITVDLFEMRPDRMTPAHATGLPAELVCSNSFKSKKLHSAHGVLKEELALLRSPLMEAARQTAVPAGSALAVDRLKFSEKAAEFIGGSPNIRLVRREIAAPPEGYSAVVIAAGPLVSERLARWLIERTSAESLHFYDAIAPIVSFDSVNRSIAFFAGRHDNEDDDYLNCPFSEDEYRVFYDTLILADRAAARSFENDRYFEACLPIEVMAGRGYRALTFGPLKPIGLIDPRTNRMPFAVCQLRRENESGTSYNMVGFQTRLTVSSQKKVFTLIPGLEKAEFLRYGSIHRNTYLDSPRLLAPDLSFRAMPSLFLAGQLCGSEGYAESIATGHLAALNAAAKIRGRDIAPPPRESALGSLLHHVTGPCSSAFTPSNIHFGLFPALPDNGGRIRKKIARDLFAGRAIESAARWAESVR
ncbi:MAG: methylenetetrahydrofolate--tRNA-(uracil(54)-C(5))-methyltransferase (FADH(2)-oxidizing) TrmFO [Chitinispirillaceae bacterium]|nr:methylenetetrahydrofolate--tRNA-(uracil(54)-C(5))-methyltransferase (FADH(2)-oxidizing) TrmFO [Chitinispirillaceae bacterium]